MIVRGYFSRHGKRSQLLRAYGEVGFAFNSAASFSELYR